VASPCSPAAGGPSGASPPAPAESATTSKPHSCSHISNNFDYALLAEITSVTAGRCPGEHSTSKRAVLGRNERGGTGTGAPPAVLSGTWFRRDGAWAKGIPNCGGSNLRRRFRTSWAKRPRSSRAITPRRATQRPSPPFSGSGPHSVHGLVTMRVTGKTPEHSLGRGART
jgi:hypothetical protein